MIDKSQRRIKSFVLRQGRFSKGQKEAFETLGSKYLIEYKNEKLDYNTLFENKNPLIIEIGFGNGLATAEIAEKNCGNNYIGIEVYKPGVGNLLRYIGEKKLGNVRIFNHDAVEVLDLMVPDNSVQGFHIFFPDPWHKKKHKKRRLINPDFTDKLAGKLKSGGYIYAVTDWEDYGNQMHEVFNGCSFLDSPFQSFVTEDEIDAAVEVPWRPETRFEEKGLKKNHRIFESYFIKK